MIEDTIANIEARLQRGGSMTPERRAELQELLADLKTELHTLSEINADQAAAWPGTSTSRRTK